MTGWQSRIFAMSGHRLGYMPMTVIVNWLYGFPTS